jgi:hypothetical protein
MDRVASKSVRCLCPELAEVFVGSEAFERPIGPSLTGELAAVVTEQELRHFTLLESGIELCVDVVAILLACMRRCL